ncbi:MAG TPA: hypothetical protein VG895_05545 [Patescibacteria group bacterium]|nr:hypothetical protein [Patescibacteria group bacterium]
MEFLDLEAEEDIESDIDDLANDDVVVHIPPNQPRWPGLSQENQDALIRQDVLDGVVVISDTMKIGKICKLTNRIH